MKALRFILTILALGTLLASCGGGGVDLASGGGGSGIGGTGITLVKGNVSNVDGQPAPNYTVSGGGQTGRSSGNNVFSLSGVSPENSFVLTFAVEGKGEVQLNIGAVSAASIVTVTNVSINTVTGTATTAGIVVEQTTSADDDSSDSSSDDSSDDNSDDDSSDESSDDESSVLSEDDDSADGSGSNSESGSDDGDSDQDSDDDSEDDGGGGN